jgi:DNA-binding NtrC family response regulator
MTRLLIVDDEPTVLFSMQKCLAPLNLGIVTSHNGREALRLAQEQRPDVVLLDVCLPDMSGLDVYDQLIALWPNLPVIVITAFSTTDSAIQAIQTGRCPSPPRSGLPRRSS